MATTLEKLAARFEAIGYKTDILTDETPVRRISRLTFWHETDAEQKFTVAEKKWIDYVADSEFDDFQPLDEFDAIWSQAKQTIECGLDYGHQIMPVSYRLESVARSLGVLPPRTSEQRDVDINIEIPSPKEGMKIKLCFGSTEFIVWRGLFRRMISSVVDRKPRFPVLRIEGVNANSKQVAADILEKLGNTTLFQIDLKTGVPMFLGRKREDIVRSRPRTEDERLLRSPDFEYDKEPMALYWYGRTAHQSPLLSFLAFYQVAEFYFPAFSTEKAHESIKNQLKDPRFNITNDTHIARLISTIKPNSGGRGFGDERAQLQAIVQGCTTPAQMKEFFSSDERVERFYDRTAKQKMPIVDVKIPINSEDADLRPQVAKRIYDIRCRIVHTKKGDDNLEILLPFSREATLLRFDIMLMEFIAQQILITTSRPLQI